MNFKSHHVLSRSSSNIRHNYVEHGEYLFIMEGKWHRLRIEDFPHIKTSHFESIKVSNNTSSVFHTNIEHMVVANIWNVYFFTNVGGYFTIRSNQTRLLRFPIRVIKVNSIPILHPIIVDLPFGILNLERKIWRKHCAYGMSVRRELSHFKNHCTHIHGQIIPSRIKPAIPSRIK